MIVYLVIVHDDILRPVGKNILNVLDAIFKDFERKSLKQEKIVSWDYGIKGRTVPLNFINLKSGGTVYCSRFIFLQL